MSKKRNAALRREQQLEARYMTNKRQETREKQYNNNTIDFPLQRQHKHPPQLIAKTQGQEHYVQALQDPRMDVVVAQGPAGTGKTYLAMLAAIRAYRQGTCERIILTRPAVAVDDEQHGFLPGDIYQKMEPWSRPLLDVLQEYYSTRDLEFLLEERYLEIAPLAYCRGRNFKHAFIIVDEAQNCTPSQLKMIMTRLGEGSKLVITGDVEQTDRKRSENGLLDLFDRIQRTPVPGLVACKFDVADVQRHRIIEHVLRLYA